VLRSKRNPNAFLKEEGANPTGTFKARGRALAVTMAKHYGLRKLAVPSAGNAAGALAAYAAAADMEAHIFMPRDVPFANYVEAVAYGAKVTLVDGLIFDCARMVAERKQQEGWFDISSLKEPFRMEGKKTMGYELVEQLGWEYPDFGPLDHNASWRQSPAAVCGADRICWCHHPLNLPADAQFRLSSLA
jgi:threonine synthase